MKLFLCGDVMTGRGINQILPHAGNPILYESYIRDAREYVLLAEAAHGRIERPVSFDYIWGDALTVLKQEKADVKIINLETSITRSEDCWPHKEVCYRMNPDNIRCITAADIDCCCLANNHVLDWGYKGLDETLNTLDRAGLRHVGAGRNAEEAALPAILDVPGRRRVLVFSFGSPTSGVSNEWAADKNKPGVNFLTDLSEQAARNIAAGSRRLKRPLDVVAASIHWGGNWGYDIPEEQISFAHRLIEEGVDIVYGHSSHHVKAMEVYHDRLVLYGCGDFLNDYEGIGGYEAFRGDLSLMYFITIGEQSGRLAEVRLVPMQTRQFRLNYASRTDAEWLCKLLSDQCAAFGARFQLNDDNSMALRQC